MQVDSALASSKDLMALVDMGRSVCHSGPRLFTNCPH